MENEEKQKSSFSNLDRNASDESIYEITVLNESFYASNEVFSPKYFKSTEMLTSNFPFKKDEDFLEIGCGIGVTSIIAAKYHNNNVVAIDINPTAVNITEKNVILHELQSQIKVKQSSVFSNIENETFDTIYWDLPYVYSESNTLTILQRSVSDPGYFHIEEFLKDVRSYLNPEGRIIVGFGSNGDFSTFSQLCEKFKFKIEKIYEGFNPYRKGITYQLFQINY